MLGGEAAAKAGFTPEEVMCTFSLARSFTVDL
jgi:hypothetical protein